MRPLFLVPLVLLAVPSPSAAAPAVTLACTSQGKPLPRKGKLPGSVDCALTVKKFKGSASALRGTLLASWGGKADPKTGAVAAASAVAEGDDLIFQLTLEPGTGFPACEKFELAAEVSGEKGPVGKKKLAVAQDCPKTRVKPAKATLTCSFESPDGTMFKYPGNGAKAKPRIERELNCYMALDKAPEGGGALKGTLKIGKKTREAEVREVPTGVEAVATFFPDDDFTTCQNFSAEGELSVDGQSIWKGSVQIPQSCPD